MDCYFDSKILESFYKYYFSKKILNSLNESGNLPGARHTTIIYIIYNTSMYILLYWINICMCNRLTGLRLNNHLQSV